MNPKKSHVVIKAKAIFSILAGLLLVLFTIFSSLQSPFDKSRGIDYLIGQVFFQVVLLAVGIVLIVAGIKLENKQRKS